MPVVCRPARAQDLKLADDLVVASINDLAERHGFGPIATSLHGRCVLAPGTPPDRGRGWRRAEGRKRVRAKPTQVQPRHCAGCGAPWPSAWQRRMPKSSPLLSATTLISTSGERAKTQVSA